MAPLRTCTGCRRRSRGGRENRRGLPQRLAGGWGETLVWTGVLKWESESTGYLLDVDSHASQTGQRQLQPPWGWRPAWGLSREPLQLQMVPWLHLNPQQRTCPVPPNPLDSSAGHTCEDVLRHTLANCHHVAVTTGASAWPQPCSHPPVQRACLSPSLGASAQPIVPPPPSLGCESQKPQGLRGC